MKGTLLEVKIMFMFWVLLTKVFATVCPTPKKLAFSLSISVIFQVVSHNFLHQAGPMTVGRKGTILLNLS